MWNEMGFAAGSHEVSEAAQNVGKESVPGRTKNHHKIVFGNFCASDSCICAHLRLPSLNALL